MDGKGVGEDQRGTKLRRGMMECNRDHAAERQPADVCLVNAEFLQRRDDCRSVIVAGGPVGRGVAVAIAWVIERHRAARLAEVRELGVPHRLVRPNPVEEDDRRLVAASAFGIADHAAGAGFDP